jgi:hypothetical protein
MNCRCFLNRSCESCGGVEEWRCRR